MNLSPHQDSGTPPGLGELLSLGLKATTAWTPSELEAALAEHVAAPMEFDLSTLKRPEAQLLVARTRAQGLLLRNLRELLHHAHPPLELLQMAKEYFKANSDRPQPGLSAEVARVLYFLTLAAAWLRHQQRITTMSDAEVRSGLAWVQQQRWVSEDLRTLAADAARKWPGAEGRAAAEKRG